MTKPYPRSISPRAANRHRLPMCKLLRDYPELIVVRRCDDPAPFALSGTGKIKKLKDEIFANENLLEMSVNLLGGKFKLHHLAFSPFRQFVEDEWCGRKVFDYSSLEDYYTVNNTYGVIFFGVSQVNTFTFPYSKAVDKKNFPILKDAGEKAKKKERIDKELVGELGSAGNNMTKMQAWLHVNHHPTILNYWHMQIDIYGVGHNGYFKYGENSADARRVRQQMREYISHIAIQEAGTAYHIGRKYYRHNTGCIVGVYDTVVNYFCHHFHKFGCKAHFTG